MRAGTEIGIGGSTPRDPRYEPGSRGRCGEQRFLFLSGGFRFRFERGPTETDGTEEHAGLVSA